MNILSGGQFQTWLKARGIEYCRAYPDSGHLEFVPDPDLSRFWGVPSKPADQPPFLRALLRSVGDWSSCTATRHYGWTSWEEAVDFGHLVEFRMLERLGVPMGERVALEFTSGEVSRLLAVLYASTRFGFCVWQDTCVIPDSAQCMLMTDHHDVVHVKFRTQPELRDFVTQMAESGYPLPEEYPDWTFKSVDWIADSE